MRRLSTIIATLAVTAPLALRAAEPAEPTLDVDSVKVEVVWAANRLQIADHANRFGFRLAWAERRSITGFSALGKRDGQAVCVIVALRPEKVDDDRTLVLGHELLHCLFGEYHKGGRLWLRE